MKFPTLPQPRMDLRDAGAAALAVDTLLDPGARADDSLLVMLCRDSGEPIPVPIVASGMVWAVSPAERARAFAWLQTFRGLSMIVGLGRPGRGITRADREWARSAAEAGVHYGIRLLGCWVAGDDGVRAVEGAGLAA